MIFPSKESPSMDNQVNGEFAALGPIHNDFYYSSASPLAYLPSQISDSEVDGYLNFDGENDQHVTEAEDDDQYFSKFPSGYRFKPLDEELIESYLRPKIYNQKLPRNQIAEVLLYSYDPVTLTAAHKSIGENEWYFFTPRDRKYPKGDRPSRKAGEGYWKATGADKAIMSRKVKVGLKKSLVYYKGEPLKGKKTDWIMHEYKVVDLPKRKRTSQDDMKLDDWVLCKIRKKNRPEKAEKEESESLDQPIGGDQQQQNCGYANFDARISNPMEHPFAQDYVSSSYAQQPIPILPWTNDPIHVQNTFQSYEQYYSKGVYQQGQESGAFHTPVTKNN